MREPPKKYLVDFMTERKTAEIIVFSVISDLDNEGLPTGETERAETRVRGDIQELSQGEYQLTFSESGEGGEVASEITVSCGKMRLKKCGAVVSDMSFSKGEEYEALYSIPPYKFKMTVKTKRLDISASAVHADVRLVYDMEIGGAKRQVNMRITARAEAIN